ncbi:hypothetical protein [Prochlorococcus sp. MIT 1300]|uniref:hypothetical protein n=1 Tax=Prochlorococcus sp. MIT 1300 TaxID=3096218 RepID=UPI002A7566F8|nr:hypothetical protein [Prochlorococcus sp. MIT 1300]
MHNTFFLLGNAGRVNLLYGVAVVGFLVGSWFLGRAITVMTKGQNPLVWKGLRKKDEN